MKIYILHRGPFGEQIINNLASKSYGDKIVNVYELTPETIEKEHPAEPNVLTKIWETPEKYVPKNLPQMECDLLLVLGIHSKLGDLIPPIAKMINAQAVLYPIDDRDMAPEAKKTIKDELETAGIDVEFPEPFCLLRRSKNKYINEFTEKFGRPKFRIQLNREQKIITKVEVLRDTPTGTASSVGKKIINFPYENREMFIKKIYEEHHNEDAENYCMAEMDPLCPLMQEAGDFLKDAIFEACGFPTTKEIIIQKIRKKGEVSLQDLKESIVDKPGNWQNPEKACDADRTFDLYITELVKDGMIIKTANNILKLA